MVFKNHNIWTTITEDNYEKVTLAEIAKKLDEQASADIQYENYRLAVINMGEAGGHTGKSLIKYLR